MNRNIERLYKIAKKKKRMVIGLMSGTSLDGLDVALCSIKNSGIKTKLQLVHFTTIAFDEDFKNEIKTIFSKKNIDLEKLCLLNPWIALKHAGIIDQCLKEWNINKDNIDLIASHGQTIYHAPKSLHQQLKFGNATLQIGDGDHLSVATGIITISDYRQKHIAAGGEGAPLAVYGDYLIFGKKGEDRILLNIGGIANFTYLPANRDAEKIFCTDTGPGNTLMDAFTQQHFKGKYFDEDASIAKAGTINAELLSILKQHSFFSSSFPKTTGPELFNLQYLEQAKQKSTTENISIEDTMATLNKFSADTIVAALKNTVGAEKSFKIFSSGGGMHNPLLIKHLTDQLPNCTFYNTADLNIDPDAKEAVLFAVLANEAVAGNNDYMDKNIKQMPAVAMGKISFPD
ncbi:MAG: anhydro-N-acetylmuramic acid kinase [Ferruginibacter sp.]